MKNYKKYSLALVATLIVNTISSTNIILATEKKDYSMNMEVKIKAGIEKMLSQEEDIYSDKELSYIGNFIEYVSTYNNLENELNTISQYYETRELNNTENIAYYLGINIQNYYVDIDELTSKQNSDGGFGLDKNYASDILDTEIALRTLEDIGETEAMINAARYVVSCQNEDGGFGYQPGLASNAELSAEIANILADCVNSSQSLSNEISKDIVELRNYLDNNAVALDGLNSDELGKVYQHFNTALFKLKMDKEYDVTSYYDLQAEDGGVFDDALATAMYLELIVREQNTIKANIDGITFTTDGGDKASVYNSYENVNIAIDSTFDDFEGYLKVVIVNPDGKSSEMDVDNLIFDTADNAEGTYTVNAYVINKANEEISATLSNTFTINRTFDAGGVNVWFGDGNYYVNGNYENGYNENYGGTITSVHKGDFSQVILNENVNLKNLEEAQDDIVISWSLSRKTEEVLNGSVTIRRNSQGKFEYKEDVIPCSLLNDYVDDYTLDDFYQDNDSIQWENGEIEFDDDIDIGTFSHNFELAHYLIDTKESCVYVLQTDISLGGEVLKSTLASLIVSGQEMSIVTNTDKNELIAPEDEENISINLREKKTVDLLLANGTEDVELSNAYADKIEEIKNDLESLGYSVNVGAAKSTQYTAQDKFAWQEYDHINYKEPDRDYQQYNIPKHIVYDGNDIRMIGYCQEAKKDFLFVEGTDDTKKVLEFDVEREDDDDWHTLDGAGFLFNTSIEDGYIEGHCVYIYYDSIYYIKLSRTSLDSFRDGKDLSFWDRSRSYSSNCRVQKIKNINEKQHIKLVVDGYYADVYVNDNLVFSNIYVGSTSGNGYGPITSFDSHWCEQISSFRFSNISMKSIGGRSLDDLLNSYSYESYDSRYIINVTDNYESDFDEEYLKENMAWMSSYNRVTVLTAGNDLNIEQYNDIYTTTYNYYGDEVYGPVAGKFFDINDETTLDQIKEYIISTEESKYVVNKEGNKVTNLEFTAILNDGSTYTKTFDELYEGNQINFNIEEIMNGLVVGEDAPILRNIKLTYVDALGDVCTSTAPDMYLPVIAYTDNITNKLTTDADEYLKYSNAILNNRIYNKSTNKTGKNLTSLINVIDSEGNIVKTFSKELNDIMISSNIDHSVIWNIEDATPEKYVVVASVYDGSYLVSKEEKEITVKEYPVDYFELEGNLTLSNKILKKTDTLYITKFVTNTGINAVKDAKEVIRIVKVDKGECSETLYSDEISLNLGRGEESEKSVSIIPKSELSEFGNGEYYIFHEVVLSDGTILQLEGDGFILDTEEKIDIEKILGDGALISLNNDPSANGIELDGAILTIGGTMHSNTNIVANTSILNISNTCEAVLPIKFNAMVTNIANGTRICGSIDMPVLVKELDKNNIFIESPIYDSYTNEGSLIASEGDITIRSSYARFKGLIYAPNGTVTIESATFNMEGRIIAKNIVYKGSVLNVSSYDGDLDLLK